MQLSRVIVAGATGFIGSHVVQRCVAQGMTVRALVRSTERARRQSRLVGAEFIEGLPWDPPTSLEQPPADLVVYAVGAWRRGEAVPDHLIEERCRRVYVDGVRAMAQLAQRWQAPFVFLSGATAQGKVHRDGPIIEATAPRGLSIYGRYKRAAEGILNDLAAEGLRWIALRPNDVYGPGDPGSTLLFLYERIHAGRFVMIGDGENRWSIINIANLVDAVLAAPRVDYNGPLLVADERAYSWNEIAAAVARALGRRERFVRIPRAVAMAAAQLNRLRPRFSWLPSPFLPRHVVGRTSSLVYDCSLARSLGITATVGLEEGIQGAVDDWLQGRRR